jgi:hypothetical protein
MKLKKEKKKLFHRNNSMICPKMIQIFSSSRSRFSSKNIALDKS